MYASGSTPRTQRNRRAARRNDHAATGQGRTGIGSNAGDDHRLCVSRRGGPRGRGREPARRVARALLGAGYGGVRWDEGGAVRAAASTGTSGGTGQTVLAGDSRRGERTAEVSERGVY